MLSLSLLYRYILQILNSVSNISNVKNSCLRMCLTDSKTLTEENRNVLFDKLQRTSDTIGWIAEILMPGFISNSMLKR